MGVQESGSISGRLPDDLGGFTCMIFGIFTGQNAQEIYDGVMYIKKMLKLPHIQLPFTLQLYFYSS